jgi:hypothetical protein
LHLNPKTVNSKSEALNPTIIFGPRHYSIELESGNYEHTGSSANLVVTEVAPSFTDKCEVKVNPDSKPSVKSEVMSIVGNQLAGQVIRELIERAGGWL